MGGAARTGCIIIGEGAVADADNRLALGGGLTAGAAPDPADASLEVNINGTNYLIHLTAV